MEGRKQPKEEDVDRFVVLRGDDHTPDREERERERLVALEEYKRAIAPVLADLAQAGFGVEYALQLQQRRLDYRRAIPVLLRWLPSLKNRKAKMDIVMALAVKWAKPIAAGPLISEFRHLPHEEAYESLRWQIGEALCHAADDSVFDELAELALDKSYGRAREMLGIALGNMRDPRAVDVLVELLADDEVAGHAIIGLGKLRASRARPGIEAFLTHPKAWVRQEAKRALAKIDRAEQKASATGKGTGAK